MKFGGLPWWKRWSDSFGGRKEKIQNCQACHEQKKKKGTRGPRLSFGYYHNAIFTSEDKYSPMRLCTNVWLASFCCSVFLYTCMPLTDNDLLVDSFTVLPVQICGQHTLTTFVFCGKKSSLQPLPHCVPSSRRKSCEEFNFCGFFIGWIPCVLSWLTQNSIISGPEVKKWDRECLSFFSSFLWDSVCTSLK